MMKTNPKPGKPCVSCARLTKFICTDCLLEGKGFIPLCADPHCKKNHEAMLERLSEDASGQRQAI